MHLARQYMRLRQHFSDTRDAEEVYVKIDELANILDCTHRNVMLVLRRMREKEWIGWVPKRGRGHHSCLKFLMPTEQLVLKLAKKLVEKKDLRGALEQMNVSSIPPVLRENFNDWLYGYFGFRSEVKNDKRFDTLRFPLGGPLTTLDPLLTNFASESHIVKQVFDNLVLYNSLTQSIEPHLAHFWEVDSSRTRWIFYLRKGVLFHHGREMTAEDVLYSLDRLRTSKKRSLYRWVYLQMKQVQLIDSNTVVVELERPNELFLPFLSTHRAVIVPKDLCEQNGQHFGTFPVGTGPFKLIRNDHSMCELEAFPYYFQGRAHLDRVEIWNIPDLYEQEHTNPLENFQIIHNANLSTVGDTTQNQVKLSGTTCKFITFNPMKPEGLMQKQQLRKALCDLLNSSQIIRELGGNALYEMHSFHNDAVPSNGRFDSKTISEMLADEDYRGETLELCTIHHYEADAKAVQRICEQAGVHVRITLLTPEQFKGTERLNADMILFAVVLGHDMELRLMDLYKSMQDRLDVDIRMQMETIMEQIQYEPDFVTRRLHFQKLEDILTQHGLIHFLYQKHQKTVYHPFVKGIALDSLEWVQFKDIWIKGELS